MEKCRKISTMGKNSSEIGARAAISYEVVKW
jgi:hypothetical protein